MTYKLITEGPFKGWKLIIPGKATGRSKLKIGNSYIRSGITDLKAMTERKEKREKHIKIIIQMRINRYSKKDVVITKNDKRN